MSIPRLLIAGTHSGVGKTTVTVGVLAALRRRGLRVAPFKVGPDYLDPGYHQAAAGRASAPLDAWMLGESGVRESFARGAAGLDVAVIEGMMGLHDGADPETDAGSTAQIAKLLQCPVLLVLDGSALARSAGAVALGYRSFDPDVRLAGVILNRVSGEGHAAYLRPAIERGANLPVLGWLPPEPEATIPERHLGLVSAGEAKNLETRVARLADLIEAHLDLDQLLELARSAPPLSLPVPARVKAEPPRARIAVARDEAFCFYYPDNLALLEAAGAEIVPFSPLRDTVLPPGAQGLYLGGGYPELHAARLSENSAIRAAIADAARSGLPLYAECGGFMYLCESLTDLAGCSHTMAGLLPGRCVMEARLQAIGYREAALRRDGVLGPAGTLLRGHEFHHSRYAGPLGPEQAAFDAGGRAIGYASGSVLASYVHLHFGSNPSAARHFVDAAERVTPRSH